MNEQTSVIFRKYKSESGHWKGGDVIALLIQEPGTRDPNTCLSYMSVGQHGSADPWMVIQETRPAEPHEYADLYDELVRIGYNLKVREKQHWNDQWIREQKIRALEVAIRCDPNPWDGKWSLGDKR